MRRQTEDFPSPYRYCSAHTVTEAGEALFSLVRAGVEAVRDRAEVLDYGRIQLWRDSFDCGELPARLEELNSSQTLRVGNDWVRFNLQNPFLQQWFLDSDAAFGEGRFRGRQEYHTRCWYRIWYDGRHYGDGA